MAVFTNPIVPGYNPDPSFCRVGEDFYLVNSSFEFFPGVPLRHSRNLVNWELIGHILDRESQLPLRGCTPSGGIYAPTIRYHEGMFYMITTNVSAPDLNGHPGNFIVHSERPEGPWSEPAWIDQEGIDPSIFFDEDGKCWFTGTNPSPEGQGIALFELDPMTGEILSDKKIISHGSGGKCPEGPHIYKKDGWYYLMLAEGGTEYGHMETIARSRTIDGEYEFRPDGPLLTARGYNSEYVQATGHAELCDDAEGNWWVMCLGIRPIGTMTHHIGRETYLAPVTWKDGWPYMANNGVMRLSFDAPLPHPETIVPVTDDVHAEFAGTEQLPAVFSRIRDPEESRYVLSSRGLELSGTAEGLSTPGASPVFAGIRQTQFDTETAVVMDTDIPEGCTAGLTVYGIHTHHYEVCITRKYGQLYVQLRKHLYDMEMVTAAVPLAETGRVTLKIRSDRKTYSFYAEYAGSSLYLGSAMTTGLATEVTETMTFTGAFLGVFAENGKALFRSFDYRAVRETEAPVRR